jgi:hypothetical protein
MVFYIFTGLVVVAVGWMVARSGVMRAWIRGHGHDPSSAGNIRQDEIGRTATWNDDG